MSVKSMSPVEIGGAVLALIAVFFIVKMFFRASIILAVVIAIGAFVYLKGPVKMQHTIRHYLPESLR